MTHKILSKKTIAFLSLLLFLSTIPLYAQEQVSPSFPIRSRQGLTTTGDIKDILELQRRLTEEEIRREQEKRALQRAPLEESDIERYFSAQTTPKVKLTQFGYNFFQSATADFTPHTFVPVGPNYVVGPGDELFIHLWGLVEDAFRVIIDRNGEITLPKIGVLHVSGMTLRDLKQYLIRQFSEYYMGFNLAISLGRLRSIQVYIVGDVNNPGTYTMTPLSTVFHALFQCGGPTKKGTLRDIRLIRQNEVIAHIDLYQFILKGDKSQDIRLEAEDTIFVPPIGEVVAITGKVKRPGIYELRGHSDIRELIQMAGGTILGGSEGEVEIERIRKAHGDVSDPPMPSPDSKLREGDLVKIIPEMVTITGEVKHPGQYIIEEGEKLSAVLEKAGGFTERAYLKGAFFTRESVKRLQQERLARHIEELEKDILESSVKSAGKALAPEEAEMAQKSLEAKKALLEKLKTLQVTGRVVVKLDTLDRFKGSPYDIQMEDGDRLYVPPKPGTVTVIGEVYNPTSIVYSPGKGIEYYLKRVGGPTEQADEKGIYVVKADGSVIGTDERGKLGLSWNSKLKKFMFRGSSSVLEPGDTILVPPKIEKVAIKRELMDWTQMMFQTAVGAGVILAAF